MQPTPSGRVAPSPPGIRAVWREPDAVVLLDQRRLPESVAEVRCHSAAEVAMAIRELVVRGAPALAVAAAHGVAVEAHRVSREGPQAVRRAVAAACEVLGATRPTAVNLGAAVERMRRVLDGHAPHEGVEALLERLDAAAHELERFEAEASTAMGRLGADLCQRVGVRRPYVHCNTGALATVGEGTALAVVYELWRRGHCDGVVVGETRPVLQGARLTAWELGRAGVPHVVVVDSLAPVLMRRGEVDAVLVGADRIAADGDVANKVGTYALAVHCAHHHLPLYVVAPTSSVDPTCATGADIPIEVRGDDEVAVVGGRRVVPATSPVRNQAFDVTPAAYVTALVTERGIAAPPDAGSLAALLGAGAAGVGGRAPLSGLGQAAPRRSDG